MGPLHTVSEYAISIIKKMQNENVHSWAPKQSVTDQFNDHVQEWIKHTVWKEDCRSWYKDNNTGRVNAVWPGSSMHYQQVIASPRYEDMDMRYHHKNQWASLGMGWTVENRAGTGVLDNSPYLNLRNLDQKWYAANGGDEKVLAEQINEQNKRVV